MSNKSTQLMVETTQGDQKFPKKPRQNASIHKKQAILESKSNFKKTKTTVWIQGGEEIPLGHLSPEQLEDAFRKCEKIVSDTTRFAERFSAKADHFSEIRANIFTVASSKGVDVGQWLKKK